MHDIKEPSVEVLLACYQGERFLAEQLDSLFDQTYTNFTIIARDDSSTDRTQAILEDYAERFRGKLRILSSETRLGVIGNFNTLLEHATADFIFFCDQDDVWNPNKIALCLRSIPLSSTPTLLHTDLKIVDADLNCLNDSFWHYSQLNPEVGKPLNRLLVQNTVTGCTMVINKALKNLACPIPEDVMMHDWWIALTAAACGKIISLPEKTVSYRQHSANTLGATRISWMEGMQKLFTFIRRADTNTKNANQKHTQALHLYNRLKSMLHPNNLEILKIFLTAPKLSTIQRKWTYFRYRFFRQGLKKIIPYFFQNRPF